MARYINMLPRCVEPEISFGVIRQHLIQEGFEYTVYDGENVFKKGNGWATAPTFIKITYTPNAVQLEAWVKYALLPGVFLGEYGMTGFVAAAGKGSMKRNVAWIEQYLYSAAQGAQSAPAPAANGKICPGCGAQLPATAVFCTSCGKRLDGQEQPVAVPDSVASAQVKEAPPAYDHYVEMDDDRTVRVFDIPPAPSAAQPVQGAAVQTAPVQQAAQSVQSAYAASTVFCSGCGAQVPAGTPFCRNCGRPVGATGSGNNGGFGGPNGTTPIPVGQLVSKSDFRKNYAPAKFYKELKIISIIAYVLVGINVLLAFVNPYILIDVALILGLTLGMHLGKSKGCAIGLLVYSCINTLLTLAGGQLGGWWWILMSAYAIKIFADVDKQYKQTYGIL